MSAESDRFVGRSALAAGAALLAAFSAGASAGPQDGPRDAAVRALMLLAEPDADDWSEEVWNHRVSARLRELEGWIGSGAGGSLEALVDPGFTCSGPGRAEPEPAFEGRAFRVRRLGSANARPEERGGAAGLAALLREIVGPSGLLGSEPHFHVDRVEETEEGVRTRVRLSAFLPGEVPGQVNASLEALWSAAPPEEPPLLLRLSLLSLERIERAGGRGRLFSDCTSAVLGTAAAFERQLVHGIDHWRRRLDSTLVVPLLGHPAGLAVADVDGDGLEDVYLCQPGGLPNLLLLHRPDGGVRDVSREAGVDFLEFTRSALFVDLDGDADRDLVLVLMSDVVFLENVGAEGEPRFEVKTAVPAAEATSLAAADHDLDGDLDLYVCVYFSPYENGAYPLPYHDARNGQRNVLLRNEGGWSFTDATAEAGLEENNTRFSFAAAWEDVDDDGDPDLYVANDFGRNNLYRNDGGTFTDVAAAAGVEDVAAGMGVAFGDYDGDGRFDLYVSNMDSSAGRRVTYGRRFLDGAAAGVRESFRRHARGNTLFWNAGDGTFEDRTAEAGVARGRWAWGSVFADLDNDGREDLFVPNGFLTHEVDDDL